jgi:hypothetical protein
MSPDAHGYLDSSLVNFAFDLEVFECVSLTWSPDAHGNLDSSLVKFTLTWKLLSA